MTAMTLRVIGMSDVRVITRFLVRYLSDLRVISEFFYHLLLPFNVQLNRRCFSSSRNIARIPNSSCNQVRAIALSADFAMKA